MNIQSKPAAGQIAEAKGIFVDNKWHANETGKTVDVYAPATGAVVARIAAGSAGDVDRAYKAARRAFEEGAWGRLTAVERGRLLLKLSRAIEDHADELTQLEALDCGKPLKQARADIVACARYFEFYGGAADKVHGDTIPFLNGYFALTERVPHGVTGQIIPWNYPAQMFGRTLGPALAVGNATVMKPAEDACLTPLRLPNSPPKSAFRKARSTSSRASAKRRARRSPPIAASISCPSPAARRSARWCRSRRPRNHIGCTLELGGKSPQVVFADVDLDAALPSLVNAIVQNAGQTCSAGSRLLVRKVRPTTAIVGAVAERFAKLTAGTPDMDLDLGPVINPGQKRRVERFCGNAGE